MPTQMQIFDLLYDLAAKDGREKVLFGNGISDARKAFEKTVIEKSRSEIYLESPLLGKPCFDLLHGYTHIPPGAGFEAGGGYGYQGMIDFFSGLPSGHGCSCGFELDISEGRTEHAGVYFQFRGNTELVRPFLGSVGEASRLNAYRDVLERCPSDMRPAYIGLMNARENSPVRIGGYIGADAKKDICRDPSLLGKHFQDIGFTSCNRDMLDFCRELLLPVPFADFQFDIWPDGSLGDTFGLSLSFNDIKPKEAAECMERGRGAKIMKLLCENGLADERCRMIAGASGAEPLPVENEAGELALLSLIIRFDYAKVKFRAGKPAAAKFYYVAYTRLIG